MCAEWLAHLAYVVDARALFRAALKTYDLRIALTVAETLSTAAAAATADDANMDPKEYLPVLNALRKRSPLAYQRFHIDLLLEDWRSALAHIAEVVIAEEEDGGDSEKLEECLAFLQQHPTLYPKALERFNATRHYKVTTSFRSRSKW